MVSSKEPFSFVAEFISTKKCTLSVLYGIILSQKVQSAVIQLLNMCVYIYIYIWTVWADANKDDSMVACMDPYTPNPKPIWNAYGALTGAVKKCNKARSNPSTRNPQP